MVAGRASRRRPGGSTGRSRHYLAGLLQSRNSAKEVRAFGLAAHLRRRHDQLYAERITELFERIRTLLADRTVLLVSHRFSSVRSADRIYVLDGGAVVESGDHETLMALGGLYAELFTLQAAAYVDD